AENTSRYLRQYRLRQQSARSFPEGLFPCAPDYFCLVCLLKRCQTYAVPLYVQAMKKSLSILALTWCLTTITPAHASEVIHKGDVVVVPLRGEVGPSLLAFLRRAVKTAESNEASAIIFDMNTYGGRLDTATDIVHALNQTKIPSYTFINTNARSEERRVGKENKKRWWE